MGSIGSEESMRDIEDEQGRHAEGERRLRVEAEKRLRAMAGVGGEFREGQFEAIAEAVVGGGRLLLVQRTGWGKSLVYFLATRLLRDRGAGPTLLISPLLALMRNQIEMAARIGVRAETMNSSNVGDWDRIERELREDRIDILLISPERLANARFRDRLLGCFVRPEGSGLFVVDEAHCVSDWGHDFRPDYRRIAVTLKRLPADTRILATTATANARVVADVAEQLGERLRIVRGPLERPSLRLQAFEMPDQADRLAWLAERIPHLPGSGIVYCLTVADARRVAAFLKTQGLSALPYFGGLEHERRLEAEAALAANEVKVIAATTALGMGYDKPDLGFVIHFQSPASLVAYYQQVGRAGRALPEAFGVMMVGQEDDDIHEHFMRTSFPEPDDLRVVVGALEAAAEPMSWAMLAGAVNIPPARILLALKALELDGVVAHHASRYARADGQHNWRPDDARRRHVLEIRREERARVLEYARSRRCLMQFLVEELDGRMDEPCGRCASCAGGLLPERTGFFGRRGAAEFLKGQAERIPVKRVWPISRDGRRRSIAEEERPCDGYALSLYNDSGWGRRVGRAKYSAGQFDSALVAAAAEFIERRWLPDPPPEWVAFIPSRGRPMLVRDFAERLAGRLGLPLIEALEKRPDAPPQKEMLNSFRQAENAWRSFGVIEPVPRGPCLLVDDIVDSGWTLTVTAVKLRRAGAGPVHPFALAATGRWA